MISKSSVQHEASPPTGLQNNRPDTAALCVVKHEACSNGRRRSKQTGHSCRDRCYYSESVLTDPNDLHRALDATTDRAEDSPGGRLLEASCGSYQLLTITVHHRSGLEFGKTYLFKFALALSLMQQHQVK